MRRREDVWNAAEARAEQQRKDAQAKAEADAKAELERLERDHPGQVLEVELERDDGRWVYEVKLLQAGGRLVKLEVDAGSGEVIRRRERDGRR